MPLKNRTSSLVNSKLFSPLFCVGNVLILAVIVSEENSFVMEGSIVLGRMRKLEEQMRFNVMLKVCTSNDGSNQNNLFELMFLKVRQVRSSDFIGENQLMLGCFEVRLCQGFGSGLAEHS